MTVDPFQRFLGLPANADPLTLLGLRAASLDRVRIETAMQERLEQVYRHPEGRSEEAERVRRRLREAAAVLIERIRHGTPSDQAPHAPAAGNLRLTDFDRYVLAVLVGCGGWNSRSRAQLVALSGSAGLQYWAHHLWLLSL